MDYFPILQENVDPPCMIFQESPPISKAGGGIHTM